MKIAVIGSRNIEPENLGDYLPKEVSEIVSGGAKGVLLFRMGLTKLLDFNKV